VTREHKLALIIGFTLILIVGVLISDHLSGQRELKLASVAVDDERATLGLGDAINPLVKWAEENARDIVPAVQTAPVQSNTGQVDPNRVGLASDPLASTVAAPVEVVPAPIESAPVVIGNGILSGETSDNLDRAIRKAGGELQQESDGTRTLTLKPEPESATPVQEAATSGFAKVDPKDVTIYRIQEKDSLYSIAKATYGDPSLWRALAAFNEGRVGKDGSVRVNATIKLPPKHILTGASSQAAGKPPVPTNKTEIVSKPVVEPKAAAKTATEKGTTHKVVRGDSLAKLAQKYLGSKDRAKEILAANRDKISDPNQIQIDMVLRIPPK
jgi:nucleoid-associated protein YgaU